MLYFLTHYVYLEHAAKEDFTYKPFDQFIEYDALL